MLKRAEPPICVGLYARWGSGKTFMISLLKKEFDLDVREDPQTRRLLQFFEEGYDKLGPEQAPGEETVTVSSLIRGLLLTILLAFVPTMPYGVTTFCSIIYDAFDPREALHAAGGWCSSLKRSCGKKAKTTSSSEGDHTEKQPWWKAILTGLYEKLPQVDEQTPKKDAKKKDAKKEFVFVDFNAWECATCVHSLL